MLNTIINLNDKLEIFLCILHNIIICNNNSIDKEKDKILKDSKKIAWERIKSRIVNKKLEYVGGGEGHGVGSFQQFLVQSYYCRKKPITYSDLDRWFSDCEHGYVHGIFTFFMYLWVSGFLKEENKNKEFLNSTNIDLVDIFQSCILHDFYRIYENENHDKKLEDVFPNLLKETYNNSNPTIEEESAPVVIGDRMELLRYEDYTNWLDMKKFNIDFYNKNKEELDLFYNHYRRYFSNLWKYKTENWLFHHVEDIHKWKSPVDVYPQFCCYDTLWCVNVGSVNEFLNWSGIPHGMIPIREVKSEPVFLNREHPSVSHNNKNNKKDFVYFVDYDRIMKKSLIECDKNYEKLVEFGIYPLSNKVIDKYLKTCSKIQSIIQINTFGRYI